MAPAVKNKENHVSQSCLKHPAVNAHICHSWSYLRDFPNASITGPLALATGIGIANMVLDFMFVILLLSMLWKLQVTEGSRFL